MVGTLIVTKGPFGVASAFAVSGTVAVLCRDEAEAGEAWFPGFISFTTVPVHFGLLASCYSA